MKIKLSILPFAFFILQYIGYAGEKPLVEQIAIEVTKESREFAFTNKQSAFYYGETHSDNKSSWQGLNVFAKEFLDDYLIVIDSMSLHKKDTRTATVYPYQLLRKYNNGVIERVTLLDSIPVLLVEISLLKASKVQIFPQLSDFRNQSDYIIEYKNDVLLIARKNHLQKTEKENYPVWIGISANCPHDTEFVYLKSDNNFSAAGLKSEQQQTNLTIGFAVGDTKDETIKLLNNSFKNTLALIEKRKNRMENLLQETIVKTENKRFDRALMWAKLSMDALIMNQVTKGIFAGLPWFNNYWGRDSFISLAGATLVTGKFEEAKMILASFAAYQETDDKSKNYGRMPNIITTTHKSYNTADGTPRFVIAALDYFKCSGDNKFVKYIFPVIERSISGTLKYHTDKNYFLIHEDAETWMDAVGPDGPWSPRGNRANDIQALWYQQLISGVEFAKVLGKYKLQYKWTKIAEKLQKNFRREFVSSDQNFVYDHLKFDGTQDKQIRPNQIFCTPLLIDELRAKILKNVITNLTSVHGVLSLYPYDENFHPYHQYSPYYVKDAAYHNGVIWTWLSGSVISELCNFDKQEMAYQITDDLVQQILDRGAIGTISELLDAVPREGEREPRLSGTFSQAWSLAEFIRNIYQDYFGVRIDFDKQRIVKLNPRLPKDFGNVHARIKLGDESFIFSVKDGNQYKIITDKIIQQTEFEVKLNTAGNNSSVLKKNLSPGEELFIYVDTLGNVHTIPEDIHTIVVKKNSYENIFADMNFVTPVILSNYPVLHKQKHPLLNNSQIKKANAASKLLRDASDPVGDDKGNGDYVYPSNPNFADGILDITNFKASFDDENIYFELKFRKLVNPGWHPEYGFQLTYAAIAIDQDAINNSGKREVGMNSNYRVSPDAAYEKIIYVGGGMRVDDKDGKVLTEYIPTEADTKNPLGDVSDATISFVIPQKFLGTPDNRWQYTILVGAQDDHGGAGLGEFRSVEQIATEWTGGGKQNYDVSNVYDVLKVKNK
jgi:glycogen debranching enzyme